ncbi:MAG: flagellar export protein FliJ [Thermoguttaceae bacterium]
MAKFKFRLATLLRLRERARDDRRAQLAQAYQAESLLREEQQRLAREVAELSEGSRAARAPGTLNVDRLLETRRFELVLKAQLQDLEKKQKILEEEIGRRREALVEANRQVRVVELLRDRQLARQRQEEERQEVKLLDEVAGRRGWQEGDA